jgi:hypothetical protein
MKARKLDLTDYVAGLPGAEQKYMVRDAVVSVLLSPELRLTGVQLLTNNLLASRILKESGTSILLEQGDYAVLAQAVATIHGFGRWDVQFVDRILNAPEVEVAEIA